MNGDYTPHEREHVGRVKELPCSVCDAPGPSEAHHIDQDAHYATVALCVDCHKGPHNGLHGGLRAMWKLHKLDELKALNITIRRLEGGR